jgi:nitrogen fixation/metabolism regulation signal transduction histidine kinase
VGLTSAKLVSNQFEADNVKQLQEKTQTIINELATQFTPAEIFDQSQKELVNLKLKEYAHLFNTDISLFSKEGNLFNASEPRLYDLGLAASLVNPQAYSDLKQNKTSATSVNEKAGELNYLSLYTPLFSNKKELIGFVNLPYYAKKADLVNELSGIISAFINVYVILFVISILSGLILAGYITRPLQLIKQQIANITLGKQNETIKWQSNDEIGKLVSEYNQMLVKLEDSANLLAQSERESAWREMAKQVAHEIKNPLTPMKLNLQYLQHLMKNNPDDFKEKFEKASAGIIEQIDSLANIANEFSSFAKFPKTNLQAINLTEIIKTSVLTFESHKNISIIDRILTNDFLVLGDKDQALRVFNNVLKNAVQALDEVNEPKIEIDLEDKGESVIISIKDNGCGIDPDLKQKLFTPNFTTKTTGSGLGLAMVKNIMQGFDGKVWFESETGKGTCFYLEFLKA